MKSPVYRISGLIRAVDWFEAAMVVTFSLPSSLAEKARRPYQQDDDHDDEDHHGGGFGVEHLGEAFDESQPDAGDDGAEDGPHAADHYHREDHDEQVGAHERIDLEHRRREHAGEGRQGHP